MLTGDGKGSEDALETVAYLSCSSNRIATLDALTFPAIVGQLSKLAIGAIKGRSL